MNTTALIPLLASSLATFFAICNPIANTPIFIGMTTGDDAATKKAVARQAVLVAFAIVVVMAAGGKLIGELFGIAMPAFKIGAGFLVFVIGYHMVSGESHGSQKASDSDIKTPWSKSLTKPSPRWASRFWPAAA